MRASGIPRGTRRHNSAAFHRARAATHSAGDRLCQRAFPRRAAAVLAAFRKGLNEIGYVEGRNVHIAMRRAEGRYERLSGLVDDLVKQQVSVIAAFGPPAALAAKKSVA